MPVEWTPLRRVLLRILADHGTHGTVSLAIVSDEEIRRVHREFMNDDTPTDVLSFLLRTRADGPHDTTLGEVIVSAETALREARKRGVPPEREVALYAIHGALHLVGFDDLAPASRRRMRRAERRYLALHDTFRGGHGSRTVLRSNSENRGVLTAQPRSTPRPGARRPGRRPRPARV